MGRYTLQDMPVGVPVLCYRPDLEDFFGFCEADVEAPDNLDKPFLQAVHEGKTLNPLGKWRGWLLFFGGVEESKTFGL